MGSMDDLWLDLSSTPNWKYPIYLLMKKLDFFTVFSPVTLDIIQRRFSLFNKDFLLSKVFSNVFEKATPIWLTDVVKAKCNEIPPSVSVRPIWHVLVVKGPSCPRKYLLLQWLSHPWMGCNFASLSIMLWHCIRFSARTIFFALLQTPFQFRRTGLESESGSAVQPRRRSV